MHDLKVETAVVVGATRMPIGELVKLGRGAIITLDEPVDAPSMLHVNGAPVAAGTIEVREGRVALRIEAMLAGESR